MQFRPVGVECPGEELPPKGLNFSKKAGPLIAALRWVRKRCRAECRHDEPAFFVRRLLSRGALFGALAGSFGRKLLKEGFNCPDP
jgi:hypothetical protein